MSILELNRYSDLLKGYTELRCQENSTISINLLNGNLITNIRTSKSGVSARVNVNGSWGFASDANISDESVRDVLNLARNNAEFLNSKKSAVSKDLATSSYSIEKNFATVKRRLSQKEIINFAKEIDDYIVKNCKDIASRMVVISELNMEKRIVTSSGASLYSLLPRAQMFIRLEVQDKDGSPVEIFEPIAGLGQFEDVFNDLNDIYKKIDRSYERLMQKKEGVYSEAGLKDCILAPMMTGMLAHEAVGHTVEADLVLGGSIAARCLNKQVASPLVNLVDFANTAFGETCTIPIYIDDEGTKAEDASIIENGMLKGYMHNKESANIFGVKPTGNARAYQFNDEPIIRMRNTAILPGKSKLEDLISSIEDGYYLVSTGNGQADSTGEFMFGITMGYEIKKGKLARAIRDTTVSGVAFDMLKTVSMVADDFEWDCAGMCGKKQPITTGQGGPSLKCKINIGGR